MTDDKTREALRRMDDAHEREVAEAPLERRREGYMWEVLHGAASDVRSPSRELVGHNQLSTERRERTAARWGLTEEEARDADEELAKEIRNVVAQRHWERWNPLDEETGG